MRRIQAIVLVGLMSATLLAAPGATAQADSGLRCQTWVAITDPSARLCVRTIRKDATHLAGVDVSYHRSDQAEGCVTARFSHHTELGRGEAYGGSWWDNGGFTICPRQLRTFHWTHAGAGAPIPPGWNVFGRLHFLPPTSPQLTYETPRVWHPNH